MSASVELERLCFNFSVTFQFIERLFEFLIAAIPVMKLSNDLIDFNFDSLLGSLSTLLDTNVQIDNSEAARVILF